MKPLFLKPGSLTLAYIHGQRAKYLSPIRLYLIFSLFFFLTLGFITKTDEVPESQDTSHHIEMLLFDEATHPELRRTLAEMRFNRAIERATIRAVDKFEDLLEKQAYAKGEKKNMMQAFCDDLWDSPDSGIFDPEIFSLEPTNEQPAPGWAKWQGNPKSMDRIQSSFWQSFRKAQDVFLDRLDQIKRGAPIPIEDAVSISDSDLDDSIWFSSFFNELKRKQTERINQMNPELRNRLLVETLLDSYSKILFLLMPLFALFLKLIYIRKDPFYIDHIIFALHFHAFQFALLGTLFLLNTWLTSSIWLGLQTGLIMIGIPVYLWLSMKTVYCQGWIKTSIKLILLGSLYLPSLFAGLILALLITVLTM